jgi:hypothetical protein
MWEAVQYATGYSAHGMGTAQAAAYTNQWYELGRRDAVEDQAQAKTGPTFDAMIDGAMQ